MNGMLFIFTISESVPRSTVPLKKKQDESDQSSDVDNLEAHPDDASTIVLGQVSPMSDAEDDNDGSSGDECLCWK